MEFFIYGVMPYIAITVLVVGSIVRYERDPFTWKSGSSQLLRRRQLMWGSILFHVGIIVIFFGHLVGLLTPPALFHMLGIGYGVKQVGAIVVGGVAGAATIVGGALLLHRRLFDPRIRATSTFADTGILILLFLQVVIGMGTIYISLDHLDGGVMVRFMDWARAIFTFRRDAWMIPDDAHWLYQVHIFLGLLIFILFPFTRLVHMFSAPVRYLWRPGYQIVRTRRRDVTDAVRTSPRRPFPAVRPAGAPAAQPRPAE